MSRTFVGAVALALALPCSASAQILGGRITAAGGTEGILDGSSHIPAYIGQLGIEWRQPGSRGALRLGLMHYQLNERFSSMNFAGCTVECATWNRFGLTGLTFDGSFDLTRSKLRPYLLSGVGAYRANSVRGANYQCTGSPGPISCTSGAETERRLTEWTFGMHAGFGLSANVGKVSLFSELRVLMLATDGNGRYSRGMVPLTFGVKF